MPTACLLLAHHSVQSSRQAVGSKWAGCGQALVGIEWAGLLKAYFQKRWPHKLIIQLLVKEENQLNKQRRTLQSNRKSNSINSKNIFNLARLKTSFNKKKYFNSLISLTQYPSKPFTFKPKRDPVHEINDERAGSLLEAKKVNGFEDLRSKFFTPARLSRRVQAPCKVGARRVQGFQISQIDMKTRPI